MLDSHFSSSYIRQATPQEASTLSTLAFRSKQFWGYSSEFMEVLPGRVLPLLEVTL